MKKVYGVLSILMLFATITINAAGRDLLFFMDCDVLDFPIFSQSCSERNLLGQKAFMDLLSYEGNRYACDCQPAARTD